jgi:hypothetical protein
MSLSVAATTIDCRDARKVAAFWSAAFAVPLDPEPAPSEFFASLGRSNSDAHVTMMFINVHDKDEWGVRWTTLTDPEGNEFCVATH